MRTIAIALCILASAGLASCGGSASNNTLGGPFEDGLNNVATATGPDLVYCDAVEQRVAREDCEDLTRATADAREGGAAFNVPNPMHRGESETVQLFVDRRPSATIAALDAAPIDPNAMNSVTDPVPADPASNMATNQSTAGSDPPDAPPENLVEPTPPPPPPPPPTNRPTPKQQARHLGGRTEAFAPAVGRFMRARLEGDGFTIIPRSPALQQIPRNGQASWIWDVTALEGGAKTLTLTTVVVGVVGGREYALTPTQEVRTVTIGVRWYDRLWDWLSALPGWIKLITAVLTALAALTAAWIGLRAKFRRPPEG